MVLLCGYLALYPMLAVKLALMLGKRHLLAIYLPVTWLLCEWLRSWMLTGFPWLSLGYSQLDSPLAGWLPIIGETGVSALMILLSAGLVSGVIQRNIWKPAIVLVVPLISGIVLNQIEWTKPTGETIRTAMVQGNIKQEVRWMPEQDLPTMQAYYDETLPFLDYDIIVWPEAAVPKLESLAQEYLHDVDQLTASNGAALITGIVNYNFESDQVYNNLIVLGQQHPGDALGHYRYGHNNRFAKHHLLPVGEFVPFESLLRGLAPIFDLPMSSFTRGDYQQRNLVANGHHIAPAICFEIAFPRQVRANLYENTQLILTVSNDAWFGRSHGPAQHMQIAQMRAKEFGLPVIRSTNNGISGFVDHRGKLVSQLPQFERASHTFPVALVEGSTPYRYFGDFLAWLIFVGLAILARSSRLH